MRNFSKVLRNVFKQYNEKLNVAEGEICSLMYSLRRKQLKSPGLETELISLKSSFRAEPCIPEADLVHAKEQFEVDSSLNNMMNVDNDSCKLIKVKSEACTEEPSKSPMPSKTVKDAEPICCHPSPQNDAEPRSGNSEANVGIASPSTHVEAEVTDFPKDQVKDAELVRCHLSSQNDAEARSINSEENVGLASASAHVEDEVTYFPRDQAVQHQGDPTSLQEQVEVSQVSVNNNPLSDVQTEPAISHDFASEKQERNERLLPASSTLLAEEMNDLDIKDNLIEKAQVKTPKTRVQRKAKTTQVQEIEVPAREAEPESTKKQRNGQKPKRRLQPASSVLLTREVNTLEIEDDITEPKGTRGGKKTTVPQPRSQGSVTLLRLLTNNLRF